MSVSKRSRIALSFVSASLLALSSQPAGAAVAWTGDLETGDLSQWNYVLNESGVSLVQSPVAQGSYAAHITLTNDDTWPNGLHRVELQHLPTASRTAEGAETYFAWSFYLPATLPTDPSQTLGYWESQQSYQQMMAFTVTGESIRFVTRQPTNVNHWQQDGVVTALAWHRIAMRVLWSKDESVGKVDVWFDGEQVVTDGAAKTLNDDNAHFAQIGLLRGTDAFTDSPVIIIDDVVEGDTLEDVRPDALSVGTGGAGGQGGTGGAGTGGNSSGGAPPGSGGQGGAADTGGASSSGGSANPAEEADSSCSMGGPSEDAPRWLLLLLAACAIRRRR